MAVDFIIDFGLGGLALMIKSFKNASLEGPIDH